MWAICKQESPLENCEGWKAVDVNVVSLILQLPIFECK